jgi:hypothetical protein
MKRAPALTIAALGAVVMLAACATPVQEAPAVRVTEAVKPTPVRALDQVLPTPDELAVVLGAHGLSGQLVKGGTDTLLAGVGEADATPLDCVSPAYRFQKVTYQASPVQAVASQTWAGGSFDGPPVTGFFGVVQFNSADDAAAFFAAAADQWHRCNGQTLVLHQADRGADASSRITDVVVDGRMVSAVVMQDAGSTTQRAIGVAADCVVDVEVSNVNAAGDAHDATGVTNLMLQKIGVS